MINITQFNQYIKNVDPLKCVPTKTKPKTTDCLQREYMAVYCNFLLWLVFSVSGKFLGAVLKKKNEK